MLEKMILIKNEAGIHARPAAIIAKEAQKYKATIVLVKNGSEYNCKSIMNLLSTGGKKGDEILLRVSGEDAEEAYKGMLNLLERNLDA